MISELHPDDNFHNPSSDSPYWTETSWWCFSIPERRLSVQLYPFFRANQHVAAAGVFVWNDQGDRDHNVVYYKNFWHLPMPHQQLSDIKLPNNLSIRCLNPLTCYHLGYEDPDDGNEIFVDVTFTASTAPHYLGRSHLDQPGRYQGHIVLHGERIEVDYFGFRDRTWGRRPQFGQAQVKGGTARGGYAYGSASATDSFHFITWDKEDGAGDVAIHGHYQRDGQWAKIAHARREVVERGPHNGFPQRVLITGVDELGRALRIEGRCLNQFGFFLNPNMFTINCLTEWVCDGKTYYGEDHDNFSAPAARKFFRKQLGFRPA